MHWQLAWRNIWRNPRRTVVIMTAIIIGVWSMVFLGALMEGIEAGMVQNGISTLTGDLQIHEQGYRNDPVVENSMREPEEVAGVLARILPADAKWTARIRVGAVASNARHSSGLTMVGIDPKREAEISFLGPEAIVEGRYLEPGDDGGIVIGKALADKFETRLGYKLVLMTQDTTKEIASRAFRIVGIFRAEMQGTEKAFAFVTMDAAEQMLALDGGISEVSVSLPDHAMAEEISDAVRAALPDTYEVNPWRELLPILDAYIAINDGFAIIWYIVVFIAMGFGIVNTTLMAIFERIREFGLLKALGMKPWWIIRDVLTESLLLLLMGIAVGDIIGFLSCWALADGGIDLSAMAAGLEFAGMSRIIYPAIDPKEVITANMVVLILGLLVGLYPAAKAARFTPVEALTHM